MLVRLFLLFTSVTLIEMYVLIRLGKILGLGWTLALVVISGLVGAAMARSQGARVLMSIRRELAMGRLPADDMIDGLILLVGGAFLITPGFLTDLAGVITFIPATRAGIRRAIKRRFRKWVDRANFTVTVFR